MLPDLLGALEEQPDQSALINSTVGVASSLGFEFVAYGVLSGADKVLATEGSTSSVILNYPLDWQKHYFDKNYYLVDPIVTRAPYLHAPCSWDDMKIGGMAEAKFFHEATEAGLRSGISVPLHGPLGHVAVVSFASSMRQTYMRDVVPSLHAIAARFDVIQTLLSEKRKGGYAAPLLTARQCECLKWVAQGKSSWDISHILCISENTVNFHLKGVLQKLETSSRVVAVVKALRLGLIAF